MNDFDWPPIPYSQYLRQELDAVTQYEYINPKLDKRYDPVVLGGNAMHPVIQRGDVVLIDTAMQEPEDGRVVAVDVGGGRKIIGYWRSNRGKPVLEQERTDKVIDLADYPGWKVYGVLTKIIGRGVPPRTPAVACAQEESMANVTGGQAQYVVERLVNERRISQRDIDRYLREMREEMSSIERRIEELRAAQGASRGATVPPNVSSIEVPVKKGRQRRARKKGHPRGIAGTFAVLTRALPEAERVKYEAMRAKDGLKAAVAALRKAAT